MKDKKIVARFKDGSVQKGILIDFSPDNNIFKLQLSNNQIRLISIEKLKAAFFVKDLRGNKDRKDKYTDTIPWISKKIQVHFTYGEIITGHTMHYEIGNQGFFLVPADLENNNDMVFIPTAATEKIVFL